MLWCIRLCHRLHLHSGEHATSVIKEVQPATLEVGHTDNDDVSPLRRIHACFHALFLYCYARTGR